MFELDFKKYASFHHFGKAVKSFDNSIKMYRSMGYTCSIPIVDELQDVELVMCRSDFFPNIELVKPISKTSPVNSYLQHLNEVIYHTCYEVEHLETLIEHIKATNKIMCVSQRKPAILFDNRYVSFYYIKDVGLFEFLEK